MNLLTALTKEIGEAILRNFRILKGKNIRDDLNPVVTGLKSEGIFVKTDFYTPSECAKLRKKIDQLIDNTNVNVWSDDEGADQRVYFANDLDSDLKAFYDNQVIREVLRAYTGTSKPNGMLLASRIEYKENNQGSGGGWHRDSPFTHQFKAICYLNDVDEMNGPFQYIKKSQRKWYSITSYLKKIFKPGIFRFSEQDIKLYSKEQKQKITSVIGKEGSLVFADTKGIHRGKPLKSGFRYVLFCYFWHGEIPEQFAKLKQATKVV